MRVYNMKMMLMALLICISLPYADGARRRKQPVDTPALSCRGVMESFSGVYDGIASRLDYYSQSGYTHYFYSPSDDRYCNRWGWKFLYNDSDRHELKRLNSMCRERNMEFVWTISPSERYVWDDEDYKFLLDKLVMMYYNGIRAFAVDFEDNAGDICAVRDSLQKDFVETRPEKVSLYMIDDIPSVNYPSESDPAQTLMKGYHFSPDFITHAEKSEAVICNLSSHDEFAKFALTAVSSFAADPESYSPDRTLTESVNALHDDAKDAFLLFLAHTGGEMESSDIEIFALEDWTESRASELYDVFDRIEKVPSRIEGYCNPAVVEALTPWLDEFGRLGTRGKVTLDCMRYYMAGNIPDFWTRYTSGRMSESQKASYERYPVGASKLHPFCVQAMERMKAGFASRLTGDSVLRNLASTLHAEPNGALDSDFHTFLPSEGYAEFAIPADANTCHLLLGSIKGDRPVYFRQSGTDGRLIAEFVVTSPCTTFDLKTGAVKVDVIGADVDIYECIFVYL